MIRLNDILEKVSAYHADADLDLIKKAYVYSAKVHQGQIRKSGEPYLVHPLAPLAAYRTTLQEFDRTIGLDRLKAFHVNDSLKPLGSRVARHAHIGRGQMGLEPFRLLVNDRRFRNRPMILETAKEAPESDDMDAVNLSVLRGLVAAAG